MSKPLQQYEATQLLMPLADAVQFPLFLVGNGKEVAYHAKGHADMDYPFSKELLFPFKCKVEASAIHSGDSYIVFSIKPFNLGIVVGYDKAMKELSLSLLDLDAHKLDLTKLGGLTQKALYDTILPSVRGMWMRETKNATWSRLDEIDVVDPTTMGHAEEADWPSHSHFGDAA
jgi:hypothetical protein